MAGSPDRQVGVRVRAEENGEFGNVGRIADRLKVDAQLAGGTGGLDTSITSELITGGWEPTVRVGYHKPLASEPVTVTVTGDGATAQTVPGQLAMSSASSGTVLVQTINNLIYREGTESRALMTAVFPEAPVASLERRVGMFSEDRTSGLWVGSYGTDWVVGRIFNGTETRQAITLSDVEFADGTAWNPATPNIYRFRLLFLGFGPLVVEVHDPAIHGWVTVHEFTFIGGATTAPNLSDPDMTMAAQIVNTSTTAASILTNSWSLGPVVGHTALEQPDGDLVFERGDGLLFETSTPLGAAGTFDSSTLATTPSGFFDIDQWREIELTVVTDQVSASDGIEIVWTRDSQSVASGDDVVQTLTFTAADVTAGSLTRRLPVVLDGLTVRYTNGGTPQGSFYLALTLRASPTGLPQTALSAIVSGQDAAVTTRAGVIAPTAAGIWGNVERGSNGGLDVGIRQQEVELQPKSTDTHMHHSVNAPATGTQPVRLDTSPPANRKYITIGNPSDSTIYYRIDDASAWVVGIPVPPDSVVQEEVVTSNAVYVVSSKTVAKPVHGISHSGTV